MELINEKIHDHIRDFFWVASCGITDLSIADDVWMQIHTQLETNINDSVYWQLRDQIKLEGFHETR